MPYKTFDVEDIGTVTIYKCTGSRSMRLTVSSDGSIRATIPPWVPYQAGLSFVTSRRSWIAAQQPETSNTLLRSGQRIGKAHHLLFLADASITTPSATVRGTSIRVRYPLRLAATSPIVQAAAREACIRALRTQAQKLLSRRLQQLADLYDMPYRNLRIKRLKTRWGSCDQHKDIVLNLFLVQLPWKYIDYVILHELAHTKVLHHGPQFWNVLEDLLPDAKQLRKEMRAFQPTLLVTS